MNAQQIDVRPSETDVAAVAMRIAMAQGTLADSPAHVSEDGQLQLCLASCYAAAGLDVALGSRSRAEFEQALTLEQDKRIVEQVYERLGWDVEECRRKMMFNDTTPRRHRVAAAFVSPDNDERP